MRKISRANLESRKTTLKHEIYLLFYRIEQPWLTEKSNGIELGSEEIRITQFLYFIHTNHGTLTICRLSLFFRP